MGSSASKGQTPGSIARGNRADNNANNSQTTGNGRVRPEKEVSINKKYTTAVSPSKWSGKKDYRRRGEEFELPTTTENKFIEQVFLISSGVAVGDGLPELCIFVDSPTDKYGIHTLLSLDTLHERVFDRLLSNLRVIVKSPADSNFLKQDSNATCDETSVTKYLFQCYVRWRSLNSEEMFRDYSMLRNGCKDIILQNTKSCLQAPDIYGNQNTKEQFIDLIIEQKEDYNDVNGAIRSFISDLVISMESQPGCLAECFHPMLSFIRQQFLTVHNLTNATAISNHMDFLRIFVLKPSLGEVFMEYNELQDWTAARSYDATLIGAILDINPCPKSNKGPYEFFNNSLDLTPSEANSTIVFIWQNLNEVCYSLYNLLMGIVRLSSTLRHTVLNWFGRCLEANRGKLDLWSAHEAEVFDVKYCSDGFCLNLCRILAQMCQPFSIPNSEKLLKIKPSYTRVIPKTEVQIKEVCVHARGLDNETPFVPYTEDTEIGEEEQYHFICECFFLTHQALRIGYNIVFKLIKLNSSISRMKKLYEEIREQYPKRVVDLVKQQLNKEICWYLNMKAAITEYHLTKMTLNFHIATASWLVQIAQSDDITEFPEVKLPLSDHVPKALSYIPQFIVTNLTHFITPLEMFKSISLLLTDYDILQHFITLILVFMGNRSRLVNSDIRAQLAEALESIVPVMNDDGTWTTSKSGNEEKVLKEHPLIKHLSETLLNVFVSIEMTGQNVDDEKKFNYRRSMHKIIQYIWRIPIHKDAIKDLAKKAVADINNTDPPLFLRFINLLINDSIFLLDEALDHMRQIKVQEIERDSGEWHKLPPEQQRDKETGVRHLGMMGRYRNIMANHTIYTLELLSREIRDIFCHSVMVDRIAGMLNYFLEHLVGPKQKDYKVKDRKEYEFKPEQVVSDIAHIYLYLGKNDHFCRAVLGESRSFSHQLFAQAVTVLKKIGVSPEFIDKFEQLSVKLQTLEGDTKREAEVLADAPDEYLDPIMGTLMEDPVTLPTSHTTIDRAVIARHLLSDQRDPFTNMPLSMDMVTPNNDLKQKIDTWKLDKLSH
ncbi:Ubiquitin conjugation factor E4 A [Mactra antiquata]